MYQNDALGASGICYSHLPCCLEAAPLWGPSPGGLFTGCLLTPHAGHEQNDLPHSVAPGSLPRKARFPGRPWPLATPRVKREGCMLLNGLGWSEDQALASQVPTGRL